MHDLAIRITRINCVDLDTGAKCIPLKVVSNIKCYPDVGRIANYENVAKFYPLSHSLVWLPAKRGEGVSWRVK